MDHGIWGMNAVEEGLFKLARLEDFKEADVLVRCTCHKSNADVEQGLFVCTICYNFAADDTVRTQGAVDEKNEPMAKAQIRSLPDKTRVVVYPTSKASSPVYLLVHLQKTKTSDQSKQRETTDVKMMAKEWLQSPQSPFVNQGKWLSELLQQSPKKKDKPSWYQECFDTMAWDHKTQLWRVQFTMSSHFGQRFWRLHKSQLELDQVRKKFLDGQLPAYLPTGSNVDIWKAGKSPAERGGGKWTVWKGKVISDVDPSAPAPNEIKSLF